VVEHADECIPAAVGKRYAFFGHLRLQSRHLPDQ
jgi:hypothetical protein